MRKQSILALTSLVVLSLVACGGGDKGSGSATSSATGTTSTPSPSAPTATPSTDAITLALQTGDPRALTATDRDVLMQRALATATSLRSKQSQALSSMYSADITQLALDHSNSSISITATKTTIATPLIVSDSGTGMAAIAQVGTGRGLAYGANVLGMMAGTTTQQQHLPLFTRAFRWLMTGDGAGALPANFAVATAGYDVNSVKQFATRVGSTATASSCKIEDPSNTCWQTLDLMVFGGDTVNSAGLSALVRSYLEAGKAVMYMHTKGWQDSAGGRSVVNALGMSMGGYPGNYFASDTNLIKSVGSTRTREASLANGDQFGALATTLNLMSRNDVKLDLANDRSTLKAIDAIHNGLAAIQSSGGDVFADPDADLYRSLILWADQYRTGVVYGAPLAISGDSDQFLRTYASDSWLAFNRAATTVPPKGSGDYMPAAAAALPVAADFESIDVTIPQSSGITLIGRGAVPGKTVTVQIDDAAGVTSLGLQTSYLRVWGSPIDEAVYKRPRRPNSFGIPLSKQKDTVFVTPFGGPLMLSYSGATAGSVVKLRIKGGAKYAHYDFTRNPSQAEIAEASAALKRGDFGWQTNKLVGGEVQQTIGYAKSAMGTLSPEDYVVGRLKNMLFDSNHFANGYNNMPMSDRAQALCDGLGWTCTGPLHRAPGVQHFIGWIATCGFLCSGNPSDGFAGIGSGWGHAHELGHNTVQRVMHIAPNGKGCVVECDNNILASATMLRQAALLGEDTGHSLDHKGLYAYIVANRATNLAGEALRADMEVRLWQGPSQDPMRAVHFQMAFQYSKLRAALAQPTMESTLEFFQLLTKGDRLVARAWDANNKAKYGMGRFANNTIENEDLFYVLSSKIIGQDMRKHFAMYGIPLSQTALDSVADLALPIAPLTFYALAPGKHNQLATGQWTPIDAATPAYPF
ncbi:ImpA family metalloprotease [Rhodoferax aquaticus]|uniref:Peptidase M60 domain-containing protein n=1 Tax=Rhodoferax aquaticus TaxID=2527691 RepID=A0A515ELT3_9BURK|nr:ImpA family metalloprotease [Rhodoferax aquaticus]QDL53589.1 hypothetical protein EXZ61_05025 [Rhodoferax aquaticus]